MPYFTQQTIQPRVKDFFTHSIQSGNLAHAYIFYGAEGRGKEAFAFELAKALNCTAEGDKPCGSCPSCVKINTLSHPDIKYIFPLSKQISAEQQSEIVKAKAQNPYLPVDVSGHKSISIETIRTLKNEAKYASFETGSRIFIINGAEYLSREAVNSFLKLLEEPPDNLYIILITDEVYSLLDTIRSRCQLVYFPEFSDTEIEQILERYGETGDDMTSLIRISQHNIKKIYRLMHSDNEALRQLVYDYIKGAAAANYFSVYKVIETLTQKRDKNTVLEFLNLVILWFRDSLHFSILEESRDFVNLDFEEKIKKFAEYYRHVEMEKIIGLVENAYTYIGMNSHPALTLTNLAVEMKKILTQKKPIREAV